MLVIFWNKTLVCFFLKEVKITKACALCEF